MTPRKIAPTVEDELARMPSWEETQIPLSPESLELNGKWLESVAKYNEERGCKSVTISSHLAHALAAQIAYLIEQWRA